MNPLGHQKTLRLGRLAPRKATVRKGGVVSRLGKASALVSLLVVVPVAALAASSAGSLPGTWRKLPLAPVAVSGGSSVWSGKQVIVFGRRTITALDARGTPYVVKSVDAAEAYDPAANTWTRLKPPPGPSYVPGYRVVWTGKQLLAFGAFHSVAYTPATGAWRGLRKPVPGGIVVWTGREAVGWGGGCCGDARSNGAAYNPATGVYRNLPHSPLAASQRPIGAWTGHELLLFVSGFDPDGKPYPARLARAAAYNPATNEWRRLAPLPDTGLGGLGSAVWDGSDLLVVGAGKQAQAAYTYSPATNRWRRLAPLPVGRYGGSAIWTGKRLLLWGGQIGNLPRLVPARDGLAYEPETDRWSAIPVAPLSPRGDSALTWTGRSLVVWGGSTGVCKPGCHTVDLADGAAFTPAAT